MQQKPTIIQRSFFLFAIFLSLLFIYEFYLFHSEWNRHSLVEDFNKSQIKKHQTQSAYPSMSTLTYLSLYSQLKDTEQKLLPLSGFPYSHTIVCKEEEELEYFSDRYGFNNKDSNWDFLTIDAAFIGDSYIQGYCVRPEHHFISLLSPYYQILNLGLFGSGPLSELGILHEFAAIKKPQYVFWTYMSNDLTEDLPSEETHPLLFPYLFNKSQNLLNSKDPLLKVQKAYFTLLEQADSAFSFKSFFTLQKTRAQILNFFLKLTRNSLVRNNGQADYLQTSPINWSLYGQVLNKALILTKNWNGKFIFLYLPDPEQWNPDHQRKINLFKQNLFSLVQELGIEILDFSEVLKKEKNPLELYSVFNGQYGHFNSKGQELLSHYLKQYLEKNMSSPQ